MSEIRIAWQTAEEKVYAEMQVVRERIDAAKQNILLEITDKVRQFDIRIDEMRRQSLEDRERVGTSLTELKNEVDAG